MFRPRFLLSPFEMPVICWKKLAFQMHISSLKTIHIPDYGMVSLAIVEGRLDRRELFFFFFFFFFFMSTLILYAVLRQTFCDYIMMYA